MRKTSIVATGGVAIAIAVGLGIDWRQKDSQTRRVWQQAVVPGPLSQSHAFLSNQCVACHTPLKGVEPTLCIACHADNTALLQRQPTAFHANVQVCSGCHVEHRGTARMPTTMDHALLASIGHQQLQVLVPSAALRASDVARAASLMERNPQQELPAPATSTPLFAAGPASAPPPLAALAHGAGDESTLNCVSCHATKDRHQGFFGANCMQCHAVTQWSVAEFSHPSARSTECAQCHKAPPSHGGMHFSMMLAPMARQSNAKVNQCFLCHQTTQWNDIKGVERNRAMGGVETKTLPGNGKRP